MTLSDGLGFVGILIGVVSLGYALWEKRTRTRLEDYVRAQNWSLYGKASNSNGHAQMALLKYKALGKESLNPEVLEFLSKADLDKMFSRMSSGGFNFRSLSSTMTR